MTLWPVQLLVIALGPAVGSFLGLLIDRLASGRSILPASACAECGARLRPRELVPILSHLAQRGRCRNCGAAIPGHLLRIEIAALGLGVLAALGATEPLTLLLFALYLWCLLGLFYSDLLWFRLPDALTLSLFALGLALAAADPWRGWADGLVSAAAGLGAFWAIRAGYRLLRGREGMGPGDVKLMAGIGAALGWSLLPAATLLAALLGLGAALAGAVQRHTLPRGADRLPLGSFLTAATALLLLWQHFGLAQPVDF